MPDKAPSVLKSGGIGDVAFGVVVSVSYLAMISASFETITTTSLFLLMGLGILYTLLGIYGYGYVARTANRYYLAAYFLVQVPLSGWIVALGRGAGFNAVLMLPLAGQAVTLLPQNGVYAASIGILLTYIAALTRSSGDLANLWNNLVTFLAGLVFVVVFTQLTAQQERARREVERLAQELEQANQRLRQYAIQAEELATSRERNRLAREIHDGLGHYLTTIHMQIQAAQAVMSSNPGLAKDAMEKARGLVQTALVDVRQSVASLRASPEQNRPLPVALESLLGDCHDGGLQAELAVSGEPRLLSPQVELTCYRTVQEGLNNVRKHAHASQVLIRLDYTDPDWVRLSIEDNGGGPTANTGEEASGGYGLLGVRERVHLLGGEMSTAIAAAGGFKLSIEVPDEAHSRAAG